MMHDENRWVAMFRVVATAGTMIIIITMLMYLGAGEYEVPATPYDKVYETTIFYKTGENYVVTSKEKPVIDGNAVVILNYWWKEYDEEGNAEWIRYETEDYRMVVPISTVSLIEVRYFKDEYNGANVQTWYGDSDWQRISETQEMINAFD